MLEAALETVRTNGTVPARYGNFIRGALASTAEGRIFHHHSPISGPSLAREPSRSPRMTIPVHARAC